jgi:uncharacterized protein (DUF433 family)
MMKASEHPGAESPAGAASAVAVRERSQPVIHSDPEIMGGTPVFFGTRVPLGAMFDYLVAGESLNRFLRHFPTVQRQQAVEALELAREALLEAVRARPL